MKRCEGFEVVNIAGEYMAVQVGERSKSFQGIVVLNEAVAFILENMKEDISMDKIVKSLTENYDVNKERATHDIEIMIKKLLEVGLITE